MSPIKSSFTIWDRCCYLFTTGLGAGAIPFAPGTWGAAVGGMIYLAIAQLPHEGHTGCIFGALLASCAGTIAVGPWAEHYFGKKDPQPFVADEIAGILFTLLFFRLPNAPLLSLAWAFVFTRCFDIVKLPPAKQLEKLPQGWGVLLDDLASSIHAVVALHLLHWFQPSWFAGY